MKTFLISDEHYFAKNLMEKDPTRKSFNFKSTEQMNNLMIRENNKIIGDDDLVIHLGDFCFAPIEECKKIFNQLKGKHILVRGNHDRGVNSMLKMGFFAVFESLTIRHEGKNFLCIHRPWYDALPEGVYGVFHGHTHTGYRENLIAAGENPEIPDFNVNLCVEHTKFKPILINEAIGRLENQLKNVGWWPWKGGQNPLV